MKRIVFFLLFIFSLNIIFVAGQNRAFSPDKLWREIDETALRQQPAERTLIPNAYKAFSLDKAALQNLLRQAPEEFTEAARTSEVILTLPMPDGTFNRFRIEHSLVVEPGLLVKFPELGKTYRGRGIDDPTATVRFDWLPQGFHSMILSKNGTILVDPYAKGDTENYISYLKQDAPRTGDFACYFADANDSLISFDKLDNNILDGIDSTQVTSGTNLRTYRLALAADGEYTQAAGGGTVAGALAAQVLIMNRVNGVYERDVAIHMNIIANNNLIVYTDSTTDPYDNSSPSLLLSQNQTNLDSVIGTANYDIGHVFTTGGGGVAGLGVPCRAGNKARGETGLPNPVGDAYAIDYVAHEMGHQFGGNHTFNGAVSNCSGGNRAATAAYEPGSGITIMAYAGICGNQNLSNHSIDTFHVKSIEEIVAYTTTGNGNGCAVTTASNNTPPTVTVAQTGLNIPKQTPFALTASATDPDGSASLTYDWQEYDLGASTTTVPNSDADGVKPIFRPYSPTTDGTRVFPSLTYILNNANVPPNTTGGYLTGEILPSVARTMVFQVIVRDNQSGTGGVKTAPAVVNVDDTSGPFIITAPDTTVTWTGNSTQTITWNVANTTNATVNAQNVKISLSTNGGNTFPTVLLASTPNDGTQAITVPNINTTQARIKIEAVDNIFFDISGANFTITAATAAARTPFDFDGDGKADISVFRPSTGTWYLSNSNTGFSGAQFGASGDRIVPADFDGDGKTDLAVFRNGMWYLQRSQAGFTGISFGAADDITVPADFDGDGKADIAVFRPSNGYWYIYNLANNQITSVQFGANGDIPVAADFDGDGKANLAVFRPSANAWYIARATGIPSQNFDAVQFGANGDKPVAADYDGDGKADVAVFRPSNGGWYILRSRDGATGVQFGAATDAPVPADYDGDGKADIAVFRSGTWYINRSQAGFTGVSFGASSDTAAPNAYIR